MTRNISYLLWILAPLWMSCSFMNDGIECDEGMRTDSIHISISFDIAGAEVATRAEVPNGGEEGDGWQYGLTNENTLHNFTVFVLYNSDVNAFDNFFIGSRYFSDDEVAEVQSRIENLKLKKYDVWKDVLTYDFTIPLVKYQPRITSANAFRFIVIANYGDLTRSFSTLSELRNAMPDATWVVGEGGTPERFVMANENDQYHVSGVGTEDDPIRMHVTIERMAARIDYNPTGAHLTEDGKLYYNIISENTTSSDDPSISDDPVTLAQLYIDKMAIVNACQKPSYYIKRVADDINGTNLVYLGDETPTPRGIATNVVIDPYSTQKTAANTTNTTLLTNLYGDTRMSNVEQLLQSTLAPALTAVNQSVILGYVNENTYAPEMAHSAYTTGMVFQCRFVPMHNYYTKYEINAETGAETLTPGTYTLGQTFYMVEPNQPKISEADRLYFSNLDDAQAYANAQAYATNTANKHFCKVVKYEGGVCYYFAYFRHSNNVAVIHNTMEFGIVRNNIYTFTLMPSTGPGTPTIDPREPEELKARVYVRKWLLVEHPKILMS